MARLGYVTSNVLLTSHKSFTFVHFTSYWSIAMKYSEVDVLIVGAGPAG